MLVTIITSRYLAYNTCSPGRFDQKLYRYIVNRQIKNPMVIFGLLPILVTMVNSGILAYDLYYTEWFALNLTGT